MKLTLFILYIYIIFCQTIPEDFVKKHKLFRYKHAYIRHKPYQYRIVLHRLKHHENLSRKTHVYFKAPWRQIAKDWGLKQNQMLRFKFIKNVEDEQVIVFYGEDPVMIPMFHMC